jgi:hypothetical protein
MTVKQILNGIYYMFFFKPYGNMPRWLEIGYGIEGWAALLILVWGITK